MYPTDAMHYKTVSLLNLLRNIPWPFQVLQVLDSKKFKVFFNTSHVFKVPINVTNACNVSNVVKC